MSGAAPAWSMQVLLEYLAAVSACTDEPGALQAGLELAVEAFDADVGALVRSERVLAAIGFRRGRIPYDELVDIAAGADHIPVPVICDRHQARVLLDVSGGSTLLLWRAQVPFDRDELALLHAMGRILLQTARLLAVLEDQRALLEGSRRHAEENAALIASVRKRQEIRAELLGVQRAVAASAPLQEVLDRIVAGTAAALGEDFVILHMIDDEDPETVRVGAAVGWTDDMPRVAPVSYGVNGQAMAEDRLVVVEDYVAWERATSPGIAHGARAVVAAPIHCEGEVVGSLLVCSRTPGRRFDEHEQSAVLSFAEVVSLALNDHAARSAMRRAFEDAEHRATHDSLTGLPNRALVVDRLGQSLARARRSGRPVTVLFIDLDRFKRVNDSFGHSIGDEVLIRVAERLVRSVRPTDTVARLSGDEFVVVCEDLDDVEVAAIADRLCAAVAEPIPLYGRETVMTASVGMSRADGTVGAEQILQDADVAMYRAKEGGRGKVEMFDASMRAQVLERLELERYLRQAPERGELRLHYQPLVLATDGSLTGVEALVRWEHPDRGLLFPDTFIPVAEEAGFIKAIDTWVLGEACQQLGRWRAAGDLDHLRINVNISSSLFADPDFVSTVERATAAAGIPPDRLALEITESVFMEHTEHTGEALHALRALGCRLSIDDFGTGYSSLSYLQRFPVDELKIDRSFVMHLDRESIHEDAIIRAVLGLAEALGLSVVAEGVERAEQGQALQEVGCRRLQGYLFGRPIDVTGMLDPNDLLLPPSTAEPLAG